MPLDSLNGCIDEFNRFDLFLVNQLGKAQPVMFGVIRDGHVRILSHCFATG